MPDLPHEFRTAAFSPSTSEAVITLLKLTLPGGSLIRLSDHATTRFSFDPYSEGTTHDGENYEFGIKSVAAPGADGGALPESTIVIQNVDGQYDYLDEQEIEDVTVEVIEVLKSDPEVIIRSFANFSLAEVSPEGETLTLSLGLKAIEEERFPTHGMSKSRAPGIFAG